MQDIFQDALSALGIPRDPPGASLFVLLVAFSITVFSTLISRRLLDLDKLKRYTRETKEFQALKLKATKTQDRRILKKVEDNQTRSQKMQRELATMRLKPLMYTFIPLIAVFALMNTYFAASTSIIANVPFSLPESMIFQMGYDCHNIRADGTFQLVNGVELWNIGWNFVDGTWRAVYPQTIADKCVNNPTLHYLPTYIGWYFAINIVIGAIIQKLAGLTPD